ncbi:hypothetical protein KP509_14G055200 [Ceratopteris richardii]|uniref:BHLH domain-containing protein n=1 Tax=Ceratopteris richardii TaxID=49495 RepID=A0A8T2TCX5_CERRI|nr:hypothetical protein KP509_14G055200 [Ceratopteris richardii]
MATVERDIQLHIGINDQEEVERQSSLSTLDFLSSVPARSWGSSASSSHRLEQSYLEDAAVSRHACELYCTAIPHQSPTIPQLPILPSDHGNHSQGNGTKPACISLMGRLAYTEGSFVSTLTSPLSATTTKQLKTADIHRHGNKPDNDPESSVEMTNSASILLQRPVDMVQKLVADVIDAGADTAAISDADNHYEHNLNHFVPLPYTNGSILSGIPNQKRPHDHMPNGRLVQEKFSNKRQRHDHIEEGAGTSGLATTSGDAEGIQPALNTNGRPRAKRGSATDPQSVYARQRRERINERLKILQNLVPNGGKVDIVTMLEEAISYVKFLQLQVKLLSSDEYWMYAPTTYNGMDVSFDMMHHSKE